MTSSEFTHQKQAAESALHKAEQIGALHLEAQALWSASVASRHLGENQNVLKSCSRGAEMAKGFDNRRLQARFLTCVGNIQSDSGNYEEAIRTKKEALQLATKAGAKTRYFRRSRQYCQHALHANRRFGVCP